MAMIKVKYEYFGLANILRNIKRVFTERFDKIMHEPNSYVFFLNLRKY